MQAIILAAGMGRRLGEFTADNTKCMLEVNGIRLIDRLLKQLQSLCISRIIIVIGYEGHKLKKYICENYADLNIVFIDNSIYDKTNNIYSLYLSREYMVEDDTLLLESDLIMKESVIRAALDSPYQNVALISKYETWMDGTMVKIDENHNITSFVPKAAFKYSEANLYYKTVNAYKFSKDFIINHYLPFLEAYIKVMGDNEYYEQVLRVITVIDKCQFKGVIVPGTDWYEIDDVQDLRIAETNFATPSERLTKLQKSFGGYWRYPGLTDFCYLVNPYFPTQRMIEEIKGNFESLLRDYPSGMQVNSLLGSKYFSIRHEYVVVGNGAAELIKSLMDALYGKFGIVYPTFEEYPNRLHQDRIVDFHPQNDKFSYSAEDLIDFYSKNRVENLLIVNPDNPSGNFIDRDGLDRLLKWSQENRIRLIIDESFVDFSDKATETTLLHNDILESYPTLCVLKSISKSYGVPGLRLGILASADKNLVNFIRKDVGIWNINSFAEFYMQIYGKYENDYHRSRELFCQERNHFQKELQSISFLKVIPSQANYFLCEITDRFTSYDLTLKLLTENNILIKDCSSKKGFTNGKQYVRIAIRNRHDDSKLYNILKLL